MVKHVEPNILSFVHQSILWSKDKTRNEVESKVYTEWMDDIFSEYSLLGKT